MDRHQREGSPYRDRRRTSKSTVLTYKKLQAMPTNLRKKAVRQARNNNETILGKRKKSGRRRIVPTARRVRNDFDQSEHNAMLASTSRELRHILENFSTLSDIPHDITTTELLGEVSFERFKGVQPIRIFPGWLSIAKHLIKLNWSANRDWHN